MKTIHIYTSIKSNKHLERMNSLGHLEKRLHELLRLQTTINQQPDLPFCKIIKGKPDQFKIVINTDDLNSPIYQIKFWINEEMIDKNIVHQSHKEEALYIIDMIIQDVKREKDRLAKLVLEVNNRELRFKKK